MENELPKRKPTRLRDFDYSSVGAYFVTICTESRRKILSRIVGGDVLDAPQNDVLQDGSCIELLPHGRVADRYLRQMGEFYEHIKVEQYVIMPNHIHLMLFVSDSGSSGRSTPTKQHSAVSRFVSTFKRFCNKEYGANVWQRHFNDHIIRNRTDYEEHLRYIAENPMRWFYDELYSEDE